MITHTELFGPVSTNRFVDDPVVLLRGRTTALPEPLASAFEEFSHDFDDLPDDRWLKTDYVFRQRRFSLLKADTAEHRIDWLEHRAFYQNTDVNPYAGGIQRQFAPLTEPTANNPFLHRLVWDVLAVLPEERLASARYWEVGVHLMRILAFPGKPGYPAPEGRHHDGHAFTSISLIDRTGVEGGRSLFFDLDGRVYRKLELEAAVDTVVFEDPRCQHDVTPVTVAAGISRATRDVCGFSLNPCE